jgi:hypothetical protein
MSQELGRAAKFIRVLESAGMTADDFQLVINDYRLRTRWMKALAELRDRSVHYPTLPIDPDRKAFQALVADVYQSRKYFFDSIVGEDGDTIQLLALVWEHRTALFAKLTEAEVSVITWRYGLFDGNKRTLEVTGEQVNLSRTRVRELQRRALAKLGHAVLERLRPATPELVDDGSSSIIELELSERTRNCLKRAQINTINELLGKTEDDLADIINFGQKSINEVKEKLAERGLALRFVDD